MKTLLIGFGYLAQRLQRLLPGEVTGIRRSPSDNPSCKQVDATDLAAMSHLLGADFDHIVLTLTPSERSDEGYCQAYIEPIKILLTALAAHKSRPKIVFVSSTAVYGQNAGEWVDEASVTEPKHYNGKRLLEAEQRLLSAGLPVICARFSGIYGAGRETLLQQVKSGLPLTRNLMAYSNRVHVDDGARALAHLLGLANPASLYNVTDNAPVLLAEVVRGLASYFGVNAPDQTVGALFSGKRLSNTALRASGFQFNYPSWREGYGVK